MGTATILQLPQAQSLTGAEAVELVQNGTSVRGTSAQVAELAAGIAPVGPTAVIALPLGAGASNNYAPPGFGPSTGFLDLTPFGVSNITGLIAGYDGQYIIITNVGGTPLTLNALNAGSIGANQFRLPADLILTQNDSQAFKYSAGIQHWVKA
jgi:hypothetical protein